MCGASGAEKQAGNLQQGLTSQMIGQMSQVFGNDSQVFNNLMSSLQSIVAGGPGQQGFSQAELNAMNSQAITNNANQFKNVSGAVKSGQAAQGGGNTVNESGATISQNTGIAEASAANTANTLNQITQANYATGRQNYFNAVGAESALPGQAFGNVAGLEGAAQSGANANFQDQSQIGQQGQWWQKDVMGLVGGAAGMFTGGLGRGIGQGLMTGGGGMAPGETSADMGFGPSGN